MSLFGDIAGGVMLVGGSALSFVGAPEFGAPIAAIGGAVLKSSMADDQVKKAEQYNSPQAQMARFGAAGLNPNLIYGQAGYTAPVALTGDVQVPQPFTRTQLQQQSATLNNTNEMIKTAHTVRALQTAEADKAVTDADGQQIVNSRMGETFDADVTAAKLRNQAVLAGIDKTQADTQFTIDANQRAALMNPANLQKTITDIAYTNQLTLNAQDQDKILKFSASMSDSGINPDSPEYLKVIMSFLDRGLGGLNHIR